MGSASFEDNPLPELSSVLRITGLKPYTGCSAWADSARELVAQDAALSPDSLSNLYNDFVRVRAQICFAILQSRVCSFIAITHGVSAIESDQVSFKKLCEIGCVHCSRSPSHEFTTICSRHGATSSEAARNTAPCRSRNRL